MPLLSIVIPAYNEGDRIGPNLRATVDYCAAQGIDAEIIVVADAPTDGTADIVRAVIAEGPACPVRLIEQERNGGKGAAVRRGMLEATGDCRLFMDADLATPLAEIGNLLPHLDLADVVIASRSVLSSELEVKQPLHRQILGWGFRTLVSLSGVYGVRDSQCGFKLFSAAAARDIFTHQRETGFALVVASHSERLALRCRRILLMDSGRLVATSSP